MKMMTKSEVHNAVIEHCEKNSYSVRRLDALSFGGYSSFASYHINSDVVPDGLSNDLATQPTPILLVSRGENGYIVEDTQYTKSYFFK